ncbi:MAG: hypothetical protein DI533_14090 [Cereibacter sphaeroides]|uniref:Uncharacterized protein n=1 Tax=Cereibacter sphaeroides TaxID=1063 RepID=A0A2W5TLX0_CERSP|nr:MAG: hypothetical protein DI533_14090 [Cereibacter sphaeroides]
MEFTKIFDGNQDRYIVTDLKAATKNLKGKLDGKTSMIEGTFTEVMARDHMEGKASYGVSPVRSDSTCIFGVLDIDSYDMDAADVLKVRDAIKAPCAAFRSKSRGLHVYVFATEPVPARVMHDYLVTLRKRLPRAIQKKAEFFPKETQTRIARDDKPTSVNLPMCGQSREPEFLISPEGHASPNDMTSIHAILEFIDGRCRIPPEMMTAAAQEQPVLDASDLGYRIPSGPIGRNDLLMRIARSMQARGWTDHDMTAELHRLNKEGAKFHPLFEGVGPLTTAEVDAMLKTTFRTEKGTPGLTHYRNIEKFNRDWAVIDLNGTVEYLRTSARDFTTYTKQNLFDKTATQQIQMGKYRVPLAKVWIEDIDRAEFDGIVCEPVDYDGPGYNVWKGFAVEPKEGDASIFVSYIRDVLCSGDEGLAHWVTMWLADACQRPTHPSPPTAIALRGAQGSGKSFLQQHVLTSIFGARYVFKVQEAQRALSRFNRPMFGAVFVAFEEAIFYGSEAIANQLKDFITSDEWAYEEKFKATIKAKNIHRVIITTNSEQAVHLDADDRRWTVVEVPQRFDITTEEGQAQSYVFWEPYYEFIRGCGAAVALNYLLNYPVDRRALTYPYGTEAKARDKIASDPILAVLEEIAISGICPDDERGEGVISNKTFYREFRAHGGTAKVTPKRMAMQLDKLLPNLEAVTSAQYLDRVVTSLKDGMVDIRGLFTNGQRGRRLGSLVEFRDAVSHLTKGAYDDGRTEWGNWSPPVGNGDRGEVGSESDGEDIPY